MSGTVYIAGPMRGYPQFNFPAFFEAERQLKAQGYLVVNPAWEDLACFPELAVAPGFATGDIDNLGEAGGFTLQDALRRDMRMLSDCTHIALLPGWSRSKGVALELQVAEAIGLGVLRRNGSVWGGDGPAQPKIIGLTGRKRVGKDTTARALVDLLGGLCCVETMAFADPMRDMLLALDPWVPSNVGWGYGRRLRGAVRDFGGFETLKGSIYGTEYRRLMQRLGTEAGREVLGEDVWVDALSRRLDASASINNLVIVTDVRFDNEARLIRERGGEVWEVIRLRVAGPPEDDHASEQGIDGSLVNRYVSNNGTVADLGGVVYDLARAAGLLG